jgi:hypothetical protein
MNITINNTPVEELVNNRQHSQYLSRNNLHRKIIWLAGWQSGHIHADHYFYVLDAITLECAYISVHNTAATDIIMNKTYDQHDLPFLTDCQIRLPFLQSYLSPAEGEKGGEGI